MASPAAAGPSLLPTTDILTTTNTSPNTDAFVYPPQYSFPPFYTLQPNLTTRASQLSSWSGLILAYAAHANPRLYRLTPAHSIFTNTALRRTLAPTDARLVLAHMVEHGRAAWTDPTAATKARKAGAGSDGGGGEVWLYWRTPEEWAQQLGSWVEATGQRNTVLTLYELLEGDATSREEFHGLPVEVAKSAVAVLVRRGRAQMLGEGDGVGVKFF
ncbi:hypothetical protein FH972_023497 [Carpinus fangiana]|uniref:ESCRT-II complex subunit VPS25 n=1 Tax=Carpinus fangiana TaxID=176857 RepID=A0A5N6KXM0_9ROSI|nr:hypothetical protein FH972_023497 [Carpinus fangiana]